MLLFIATCWVSTTVLHICSTQNTLLCCHDWNLTVKAQISIFEIRAPDTLTAIADSNVPFQFLDNPRGLHNSANKTILYFICLTGFALVSCRTCVNCDLWSITLYSVDCTSVRVCFTYAYKIEPLRFTFRETAQTHRLCQAESSIKEQGPSQPVCPHQYTV